MIFLQNQIDEKYDTRFVSATFQVKNYDLFLDDVLTKANALPTGGKVWVSPMSSYAVYEADEVSNRIFHEYFVNPSQPTVRNYNPLKKFKIFWKTSVLFVGPLIPLFWTSGDVSPG